MPVPNSSESKTAFREVRAQGIADSGLMFDNVLIVSNLAAKERALNNFIILLPLPPGEGWGEGIQCSSYFMHVTKPFFRLRKNPMNISINPTVIL